MEALCPTLTKLRNLQVVRLEDRRHWLILSVHHSPVDQMSIGIMLRDLAAFYNGIVCGHQPSLPPVPIQAGDHMAWLAEQEQRGLFVQKQEWWEQHLHSPTSGQSTPAGPPMLLTAATLTFTRCFWQHRAGMTH